MKKILLICASIVVLTIIGFVIFNSIQPNEIASLEKLANKGNLSAQFQLSEYYLQTESQDLEKALKWARLAVGNGLYGMQPMISLIETGLAISGNIIDYDAVRNNADSGEVDAQYFLGFAMVYGMFGLKTDIEKGFAYLKSAAEAGHAKAQFHLALQYMEMSDVKDDRELAMEGIKWVRAAADQGEAVAQLFMVATHITGEYLPKDGVEILRWAHLAYAQGSTLGAAMVGKMYAFGFDGLEPEPEKAMEPLLYAFNAKVDIAAADLGVMYLHGLGVEKDIDKARRYLKFAAVRGNEAAAEELAKLTGGLAEYNEK